MKQPTFQIATDDSGRYVSVRLLGTRDEARQREFAANFLAFYPAQQIRSVLVDLTGARFPDPLFPCVERFSMISNLAPRSRVALLAGDVQAPAALLLAQTLRGGCHEVLLTTRRGEAERFLARKAQPVTFRPCTRQLMAVPRR
ncbi:hypothetical protein E5163_10145 [Marinicauda algicola]|uniref:STAS/SEC14 domain-containing protein n=1 Tax=Marinicauda algicola TaxID=2029849 RepID=A0A4S2GYC8_9PROT|nr:hypothetical protein [Marinicauda algicola]TGY88187.1 hypothetical protein E5163_10145 [Marinicauda algicola]